MNIALACLVEVAVSQVALLPVVNLGGTGIICDCRSPGLSVTRREDVQGLWLSHDIFLVMVSNSQKWIDELGVLSRLCQSILYILSQRPERR